MNKSLLAVGIAFALSTPTQADIFISEIIEGSGNNKAIEIANTGSNTVSLVGYSIARNSAGGSPWEDIASGSTFDLGDYTIASGDVLVIANSNSTNEKILSEADILTTNAVVTFNGDDPVGLFINDTIHDVVGELGNVDFNPNTTLLRSYNQTPTTTYNSADWQSLEQDNTDNLGVISVLSEVVEATAPEYVEATIMQLQGSGDSSPYTNVTEYEFTSEKVFKVKGIVTHIQTTALGNDLPVGFFMQDASGDGDVTTSDGIFVSYSGVASLNLTVGDQVEAYGPVTESYDWTQLSAEFVEATGINSPVAATVVTTDESDEDFEDTLERYESMFVELDTSTDMKITRTFGFDYSSYRNNMVLAHDDINRHPNQKNNPGSTAATDQTESNGLNRLFVESSAEAEDGVVPWYPEFAVDNGTGTTTDYLRIGATVTGMQGIIGYSYSEFRLYVNNELTAENFDHEGVARTTAPEVATGDIKIATFNVLNYFNSEIDGADNPFGSNRGAESQDDLDLQTAKIVSALVALDADFVGLMEVENNGFGESSAIVALVNALNAELDEDKQYTIASSNDYEYIGTDAITNNAIYRANKLSLDSFDVIEMPQQHAPSVTYGTSTESGDNYMRDAVTPTFTVIGTDKKLTISVNHLKSKGSACYEDVITDEQLADTDLQGSCENFRVSGAFELAEKLAEKGGYTIIVGDLNSYGSEDPLLLLTNRENAEADYAIKAAAYTYIGGDNDELGEVLHGEEGAILTQSYGYVDTLATYEEDGLSYSYNDEVGTLDYILVNESLSEYVVDAAHWNINSVESGFFQYDYSYGDVPSYGDAYRSSDHDPAIVVLDFNLDSALGESITLPTSPLEKPAQTTSIANDGVLSVIVDLTNSSAASLQVGTSVSVVISEITSTRTTTSQTSSTALTEEQIAQGWASVNVQGLSEGTVSVASYIGEELVATDEYTLTAAESDNDTSGGSTSIFSLLSLLGFAGWRLARRK